MKITKKILNFVIIIILSLITFSWTFFIFHQKFNLELVLVIIFFRLIASRFILKDYSLSWSKASQKTFLIKSIVNIIAFFGYLSIYYGKIYIYFLASELFLYLFSINFLMYLYHYYINHKGIKKTKQVVIYGAGEAGLRLESEFEKSKYKVVCFIDDNPSLQTQSIDNISILSFEKFVDNFDKKIDLLVIAIPSLDKKSIKKIYNKMQKYFYEVKILPPLGEILHKFDFTTQLKDISVEELLARYPKDLDKKAIKDFIQNKTILITGAGGSIGSEIVRRCVIYDAKEIILVDNSEFNLYKIEQELSNQDTKNIRLHYILQTITQKDELETIFDKFKPQVVIHTAAYKHVPLCEQNIFQTIINNIFGTKNVIDIAIKYKAQKVILISTDKAVRPTNVMGTTKRVCELYAQNVKSQNTEIVAVRFGNVLGSSGSVIPKFKEQIKQGGPITVTHPEITRYFMLIPEACELVLQAGSLGSGGEIFILDMGEPIKIVDLAKKMIELSGRDDIKIKFTGLRPGEKLYEELLINESDASTKYESITIAKPTIYNINRLNTELEALLKAKDDQERLKILKQIVPEFKHNN